ERVRLTLDAPGDFFVHAVGVHVELQRDGVTALKYVIDNVRVGLIAGSTAVGDEVFHNVERLTRFGGIRTVHGVSLDDFADKWFFQLGAVGCDLFPPVLDDVDDDVGGQLIHLNLLKTLRQRLIDGNGGVVFPARGCSDYADWGTRQHVLHHVAADFGARAEHGDQHVNLVHEQDDANVVFASGLLCLPFQFHKVEQEGR